MREASQEFASAGTFERELRCHTIHGDPLVAQYRVYAVRPEEDSKTAFVALVEERNGRVAAALQSSVRPYDLVARLGGEEFALLLPYTDRVGARAVAERCRTAVSALELTGKPSRVSVSSGIALFPASGLERLDDLIRAADEALYSAKRSGRDTVVEAGTEPQTAVP